MVKKIILLLLLVFITGWASNTIYSLHFSNPFFINKTNHIDLETYYVTQNPIKQRTTDLEDDDNLVAPLADNLYNDNNKDKPSPHDWIKEDQIWIDKNKVIIKLENAVWAAFTNTNSMDPVIDEASNAIEIIPKSEDDIHVGDIVSYKSDYADGIIIHRVIKKGKDQEGTYFIFKGDNNPYTDPGKIRFNQIERVLVAVIY